MNELTQLTVTDTFSESDPNATLSYSLLNPPPGAAISSNGIITWIPSQTQSPNPGILFTVVATSTDTNDPVEPQLEC